ncbi:MAG: hypothetical protein DLM50_05540 [Candidatus Meridianibacter frigidus]|nr:MAG: hypothetical protein DLM50_05540 [Candidatus Eremiobacteraeota bacterium]
MNSLKWRIAGWYLLLLLSVIIVTGFIVTASFQRILYDNTRGRLDRTMQDIVRSASPAANPVGDYNESIPVEQQLANSANLNHWASATTVVQLDTLQGQPEGKSENLGGLTIPPNKGLTSKNNTEYRVTELGGARYLIEDHLVSNGPGRTFVIHVAESLDQLNETFQRTQRTIASIIVLASIAVAGLSFLLASAAINPINELTLAMREIGSDHLNRRLQWRGRKDEIGKLAQTFDEMLARLEEAFARERQFISDASHELKTPLTSINANAQMLHRWADADERVRSESLSVIVNETAALAEMINGMLMLAKAESGDNLPLEPVFIGTVAADAVRSAEPRAREKGLYARLHAQQDVPIVLGNPSLLRHLIGNLMDNAVKFTDRGGIDVQVRRASQDAVVEVLDTGCGIETDEIPHIFERFYRADKSRSRAVPGTGLGLAIARSIARLHGGTLEAERRTGGGTCVRVRLPLISSASHAPTNTSAVQ